MKSKLIYLRQNGVATIESCSGSSSLQLNSQPIRKGYTLVLRSGDELSFTGSKHYSFVSTLALRKTILLIMTIIDISIV